MRTLSQIREISAQLFRAQRGNAILVTLIYTLAVSASGMLSAIPLVGSVAVFCLAFVLQGGLWGSFLKGIRGERMDVEDLFSAFTGGRFGRVLGGSAFMVLKVFLWMLPGTALFAGGMVWMIVAGAANPMDFMYGTEALLEPILPGLLLMLIGYVLMIVMGIIKEYGYILTAPLLMENPGIAPTYASRLSQKIMSGHKWQLFVLGLSFIGWNLLGLLTLGILNIVFVTPWTQMSFAAFYYEVKQEALMSGRVRPEEFMGARYE